MRYTLICFDAGFTLLQPHRSLAATLADILADRGITPTEEALHRSWQIADRWFWENYHRPNNDTWVSDNSILQTWRQYHDLMFQELSVTDPDYAIADAVIHAYSTPENWRLYDDVMPALTAISSAGLRTGIVSDWGSRLPLIIEALGISGYFDFILVSATAGAAKPSSAFYRMAIEAGGATAQQALMVGDSYYADVLGARSAGMDAILLDRAGTSSVTDVPVIRSLAELPALVL